MCKQRMAMNLLVVEFLGLSRLKELQEIPQCSLIVVSERIPWTIPVPGHHTTRQGGGRWREGKTDGRRRGRKHKGEKDSEEAHRRQKEGGRRSQRRRSKGKQQTEVGGTCYSTFLLTSADDHSFSVFHYYLPRNGVNNHFNNNNNNWQKKHYILLAYNNNNNNNKERQLWICVWMRQASYPCDLKNCSSIGSVFNLCATVLATCSTHVMIAMFTHDRTETGQLSNIIWSTYLPESSSCG